MDGEGLVSDDVLGVEGGVLGVGVSEDAVDLPEPAGLSPCVR